MSDPISVTVPTRLGALRVRTLGDVGSMPCVLWHSLFVDSNSWNRVLDGLAPHRRLILIDGPSHGASQPTRDRFTLADCAAAADQVLDRLDVSAPVDWVGNAWGGHVGITFAATCSARVRSLIAIGTPIRALTRVERFRIVPLVGAYRLLGPIGPLVSGVHGALLGPDAGADDTEVITVAMRSADRSGMHTAMRSVMLGRPDLSPMLSTLAAPTLFVAVNADRYGTPPVISEAAELLPHGSFGTIDGGGHVAPLLQSPSDLARMITDFWNTVEVAPRSEQPRPTE